MRRKLIKRILIWSLIVTAILAIVTLVASSFYMLNFALESQRRSHQEAMERFYKREPANLKVWVDSLEQRHALRDTSIVIDDRGKLTALYLRGDSATNHVAVLLHGYNDRAESMLHIAYIYNHEMGFNVLLPHFYGHGNSDGNHIDMGWLDRHDMMRWLQVANDLFKDSTGTSQMVIHGISMGGFTTMCISGEQCPTFVKCFVEDCGYTSVWDEFNNELKNQFGLPSFPLMNLTSTLCKMRYGWTFGEATAVEQLKKSTLPMLFIHGDADTFVPYAMLDQLYNAKTTGYKEKYIAHDTGHARAYTDHPEEYTQRVKSFVNRFIK
ncbi:MAG: alpha/beta hydrolase [Muribaculaceae bacterium]|nr:alpha/beta hydrolase [Muribaculaceae bacterium]